jgi:hypothetical protein
MNELPNSRRKPIADYGLQISIWFTDSAVRHSGDLNQYVFHTGT